MSSAIERQLQHASAVRHAELTPIRPSELPPSVHTHFQLQSQKCIGIPTHPERFVDLLATSIDGTASYLGHHMKHHHDGLIEEEVYVCDTAADATVSGYGVVRMQHNPVLEDLALLPFVGYTRTEAGREIDQRGRGLGTRRLVLMDTASRLLLNGPVHSGESVAPQELRIWQRFEAASMAARVAVAGHERFRFL